MVNQGIFPRQVFAHRGAWNPSGPQGNSTEALFSALNGGFSLETDIRDHGGNVVISHDPLSFKETPISLGILLAHLKGCRHQDSMIALNIKSDGLSNLLAKLLENEDSLKERVYFFDMSIPESIRYSNLNLPFALRLSEYEPLNALSSKAWPTSPRAIWIDGFHHDWFLQDGGKAILELANQHIVTIVSPELHGRNSEKFVDWFLENGAGNENLTVCTDLPERFLA